MPPAAHDPPPGFPPPCGISPSVGQSCHRATGLHAPGTRSASAPARPPWPVTVGTVPSGSAPPLSPHCPLHVSVSGDSVPSPLSPQCPLRVSPTPRSPVSPPSQSHSLVPSVPSTSPLLLGPQCPLRVSPTPWSPVSPPCQPRPWSPPSPPCHPAPWSPLSPDVTLLLGPQCPLMSLCSSVRPQARVQLSFPPQGPKWRQTLSARIRLGLICPPPLGSRLCHLCPHLNMLCSCCLNGSAMTGGKSALQLDLQGKSCATRIPSSEGGEGDLWGHGRPCARVKPAQTPVTVMIRVSGRCCWNIVACDVQWLEIQVRDMRSTVGGRHRGHE